MSKSFIEWVGERNAAPLGSWLSAASPTVAEALGWAGFDFLVVDLEHAPLETAQAIELLRAIAVTPTQPVVRIADNDPVLIKRALDIGTRTLMLPFVQNAEQARAAVEASFYPPQGMRGVAALHRASRYATDTDYFVTANADLTLIAEIETPDAADQLEAIAAVEGISALFIGTVDLAAYMGHIGRVGAPEVQVKLKSIAQRCRAASIPCGCAAPSVELAQRCLGYGFDFITVASDLGLMMNAARNALVQLTDRES